MQSNMPTLVQLYTLFSLFASKGRGGRYTRERMIILSYKKGQKCFHHDENNFVLRFYGIHDIKGLHRFFNDATPLYYINLYNGKVIHIINKDKKLSIRT